MLIQTGAEQGVVHADCLAESRMLQAVSIKSLWKENELVSSTESEIWLMHSRLTPAQLGFYCLILLLLDFHRMLTQQTNTLGFNCHLTVCLIL